MNWISLPSFPFLFTKKKPILYVYCIHSVRFVKVAGGGHIAHIEKCEKQNYR